MIPLNQISVATPCHESWDDMTGDDKKRFCCGCKKNVFNLSAMTEAEAQSVLKVGNPCVRFYRRVDGTVLTQDCPVGVKRVRRRRAVAISSVAALLTSATACNSKPAMGLPANPVVHPTATMGAPPPMMGGVTAPQAVRPTAIMGDVVCPTPKPTQGQPAMMGKVAAPSTGHKPPKKGPVLPHLPHSTQPIPPKGGVGTPPPHPVPMMGLVALPPSHNAPTLPKVKDAEPTKNN